MRRTRSLLACLALAATVTPGQAEQLILVADLNGRYGSTSYHARVARAADVIVERGPDLVVSAGDMVAGQSPQGLDDTQLEAMWSAFEMVFARPLGEAEIPLAVTVGNHDGSAYPGFERDRARFEAYWRDAGPPPGLLPGGDWPWRYAMRHEGLLAIAFDGTRSGDVPEREHAFVRDMLERHGAEAEWTMVFAHLPFWPLARGRERDILRDEDFLALLHAHGVDAYASGHHHLFYAGLDEAGMLHLSVGALGGNARVFVDGGPRQPHGMVALERRDNALHITALLDPAFDGGMSPEALPAVIAGPPGPLQRVDGPVALRD